jgi:hypothetical protein
LNVKRFVIAGIVTSVLFLVLDAVFGVAGGVIGESVFGLSAGQPDESKMMISPIFELINGFMLVAVYAVIYDGLPGEGWRKGISYGLIVWGLRVVMWAFSTYIMTDMSPILIGITVATGLVEVLILCVVIAAIYKQERSVSNGR